MTAKEDSRDPARMAAYDKHFAEQKALWPKGPWEGEPDRVEWKTHVGLPGLIVRNDMGALCGYVAVPPGHPVHGRCGGDIDVGVHGGVSYADACHGDICHVPAPGEPDNVWWIGFDCSHAFDQVPGLMLARRSMGLEAVGAPPAPGDPFDRWTYKGIPYVTEEVEDLAAQLAAMVAP